MMFARFRFFKILNAQVNAIRIIEILIKYLIIYLFEL